MRAIDARHNQVRTTPLKASLRFGWGTIPMICAYVFVVWGTFLWFEPAPIANYARVYSKAQVIAGESVFINARVWRTKDGCSSTVRRVWMNESGGEIFRSIQPVPALGSGEEKYKGEIIIPLAAKPGRLILHTAVEFQCNPVQQVLGGTVLVLQDVEFTVVGSSSEIVYPQAPLLSSETVSVK